MTPGDPEGSGRRVCTVCDREPALAGQSLCIGCRVKVNEIALREFGTIDLRGIRFRDWLRYSWRHRRMFRSLSWRVIAGAVRDGWRRGRG